MRFSILDEADAAWPALLARFDERRRDIHYLPEYGAIYRRTYGFEPFLAVLDSDRGLVMQAFVKRSLNALPFLEGNAEKFFDVANPYGYGGPLIEGDPALLTEFDEQLRSHLRAERIPAEFTSLHPLLGNHRPIAESGLIPLVDAKAIVYIDLSLSEDELLRRTRSNHRRNIAKAEKAGVRIEKIAPQAADFETFNRLYYATMERNQAADRWYFPPDYFRNCWELLGADRVSFFFAIHEGRTTAAWIVMHAFDTAYYHFGGSDSDFYALRPNNLMVHEVARWAKRAGYRALHLGGGVTSAPDDPLFLFKSGYAHETARLYTYGRVHDRSTYDRLCRLKEAHELSTSGQTSQSDFFPLYRR